MSQRFNVKLPDEVHSYFKEKSLKTGVSMAALIILALQEYIDQKEGIKAMNNIQALVEQLQVMQEQKGGEK